MAVGDFNHDGKLDIAVLQTGGIGIWLGNGDGTFSLKTTVAGVTDGYQLIAVDLNRDHNLDLVTPNDVFIGKGDGTFVHASVLNVFGDAVATADFNGDGLPDLAVSGISNGTTWIFLGKGDGTFGAPYLYGISAQELLAGDFNHDGIPDLVIGTITPDLLLGKGDGTFSLQATNIVDYVQVWPFRAMVVADFNNDGRPDLGLVNGSLVMAILNTTH